MLGVIDSVWSGAEEHGNYYPNVHPNYMISEQLTVNSEFLEGKILVESVFDEQNYHFRFF